MNRTRQQRRGRAAFPGLGQIVEVPFWSRAAGTFWVSVEVEWIGVAAFRWRTVAPVHPGSEHTTGEAGYDGYGDVAVGWRWPQ